MGNLDEQKLDALAEFAAGAGHEINNPLAIIGGRARLLLREIEHPEHRRQLGVIIAQVQRAYEMIADIRFFARPPQPEIVKCNLQNELQNVIDEQIPLMQESDIRFETNVVSADNTTLYTDPVLLHLAVSALCNNAREAVKLTGGSVVLSLQRQENVWAIRIKDTGPGISEDVRDLIFDPYYSGRQAGRGLGFGLPKTWRITQLLGGTVQCESGQEQETVFLLTLPVM